MKKILIAAVGLCFFNFSVADEILYCSSELRTGFKYEKDTFAVRSFRDERLAVKVNGDFESIEIDDWDFSCRKTFLDSVVMCHDIANIGNYFRFNKENGRYLSAALTGYGYLSHSSNIPGTYDTDDITAGKCVKF